MSPLEELVTNSSYCLVTEAPGYKAVHFGTSPLHVGFVGKIENQDWDALRRGVPSTAWKTHHPFSINTDKRFSGAQAPKAVVHYWCYPYGGDRITFYDAQGYKTGEWDGSKVILNKNIVSDTQTHTDKDGALKLFKPNVVKRKDGHQAQVLYNDKIVWEGTTLHQDDPDRRYDEGNDVWIGKSGSDKAYAQAHEAVATAVETLFAKIKE